MMEPKRYATAATFRRALEDRLQDIAAKESVDLQRLRRQVAFDRLLARLFQTAQPSALPWVLKGGYAMELRIKAARTTKDIDLTMRSVPSSGGKKDEKKNLAVLEKLQEAAAFKGDDFFAYTIGEPISDLDAAPYGGARFPVEARIDGRVFVGFHVDVGIGDAVMEPLEVIEGRDWLGFAGVARPSLYMIPREQQFAEKLHAYTLPRQGAMNSRVRDLVDMVLLIQSATLVEAHVGEAIRVTFERRGTHSLPKVLPKPPADWAKPYDALAKECGLSVEVDGAFAVLDGYLKEGGSGSE
ncbi:MAG: nucleotidyl transferase AbiEii/AbiGii toxin family protein [Candidatus Acidiferrales bacterium]